MTNNDTNTLNGALQELGETMAANLVTQGVQASASDGLTTLAGKILDIQGGGGSCYHIEFSEASYTAVGGSATLEISLQENYAPKSGATISVSGSDSSLYTGLTDSTGVATVTVSVNSETTFTASYSNVTDTCSVTVQSYLFKDECSSDNTSQYGTSVSLDGKTTTESLSFSTDHYILSGSGSGFAGFIIPNVNRDDVKVRIKFKLTQTNNGAYNQFGIGVGQVGAVTTNNGLRARNDKKLQQFNFTNGTETEGNVYTHSNYFSTDWFYAELIKQGTSLTIKLYDKNLTQLATNTRTITNYTNPQYIFYNLSVRGTSYATHIQEILVEPV